MMAWCFHVHTQAPKRTRRCTCHPGDHCSCRAQPHRGASGVRTLTSLHSTTHMGEKHVHGSSTASVACTRPARRRRLVAIQRPRGVRLPVQSHHRSLARGDCDQRLADASAHGVSSARLARQRDLPVHHLATAAVSLLLAFLALLATAAVPRLLALPESSPLLLRFAVALMRRCGIQGRAELQALVRDAHQIPGALAPRAL